MAHQKRYIVLRRQPPELTALADRGDRSRSSSERDMSLTTESLTEHAAKEARKDPGLELAEEMPTCLIRPIRVSGQANDWAHQEKEESATGSVWGIDAIGASASRWTGAGVVVAVLDTGIQRSHAAFKHLAANQVVEKDFTGQGNGDENGHGTHCAGTLFGDSVNGIRIGI